MGKGDTDQCVFPLTSLQLGDLQSYLSELSLFLATESKKLYILVDNRPWMAINSRPAQLWQLMVTKSRLSPFANTKARRQKKKKKGKQSRLKDETTESRKLEKWSALIDAASTSHKRVLLPVKKLRKSLQLRSELHRTLYGLIIFEVEWDNVRGINYLNELQTDTCLALDAMLMKRWEFDSIRQAANHMSSWFTGTSTERHVLKEYLIDSAGDEFYDAEEEFPVSRTPRDKIRSSDPCLGDNTPTTPGSRFSVFSTLIEEEESVPHTPPLKRRRVTKFSNSMGEQDLCSDEKQYESEDSMDSSSVPCAENSVDIFEYRDTLIIFRFNDRDLPFKLRQIIMSDLRLLTLLESGLPSWVIFLQSYPVFCHLYRPWMCPLARALYVLISVVTVLIGFYDLYKNVPVLKATASHLCGPLFDWIETWEMVTRIKYLGTMLFLHNCQKALKWFLMVTSSARSFFLILVQPLSVPLLEVLDTLLPLWSALSQTVCGCCSVISVIVGSLFSLVGETVEVILQPLWLLSSLAWSIGNTVLYPVFWMLCEIVYLPIRMILTFADSIAFIWTYSYGSIIEVWQSFQSLFKIASATNTAVSRTYEVSKWRLLWNDLFSQVFRALRTILNGFVAFFTACNRHRLSIYNHTQVMIQKYIRRNQRLKSQEQDYHRPLQPKSPSAGRRKNYHHSK